jgi:hypothetical protein
MKTSLTTLLNSFKMLKSRSHRSDKLFPLNRLDSLFPYYAKINSLALGRTERLKDRIRITHNLFLHVKHMSKHHGEVYTVKWLKASSVALQKYLAGDPISSLRKLEPKLPLPRLINGCPAIINRRDRQLMRQGNTWIQRFWLSQFAMYRILKCKSNQGFDTILAPFSGSMDSLLTLVAFSKEFKPFAKFMEGKMLKAPTTFVLSHKASPVSTLSYRGLLTDWHNLKWGTTKLTPPGTPENHRPEYLNILGYVKILESGKLNTRRWHSLTRDLDSVLNLLRGENLALNCKSTITGSALSQWAFKVEAAGKLRVFALLDSISQSLLRPLHDLIFDVLRLLPNDGTFDQDSSVNRSTEKMQKYGIAYSFDLSAATDRLPVLLTAQILETFVGIPGFGAAWKAVIADRDFSFNGSTPAGSVGWALKEHYGKDTGFRYSVGQPMGGLSSWGGLAITHHWILQYCSFIEYGTRFNNQEPILWEDRYEILGDDIVIFDKGLAMRYLEVMNLIGVEINQNKSISGSSKVFEFAKRTIYDSRNVSGISPNQVVSSTSIGARVMDAHTWLKQGLVKTTSHLGQILAVNSNFSDRSSFRSIKKVGLPALSMLNLLLTQRVVELRLVLEFIVNPRYEDFDFEKAKFALPLHSLLRHCLACIRGLGTINSEQGLNRGPFPLNYPLSRFKDRREFSWEYESHISAVVLQEALAKGKTLVRDYENLLRVGARAMFKGQGSKVLVAQMEGFITDLVLEFSDLDVAEFVDDIEQKLYNHAKYQNVHISEALKVLDDLEALIFKFTFKTEISRSKYDKDSSPILTLLRKSEGKILIPYWNDPVYL